MSKRARIGAVVAATAVVATVVLVVDDKAQDEREDDLAGVQITDEVGDDSVPPLTVGTRRPPTINAELDVLVRESIVKVSGRACRQAQEGSGWVTMSGLVVTSAHAVAGQEETTVENSAGEEYDASVVAFDPVQDLAVLRVAELDAPGLPLGNGSVGDLGAAYDHRGSSPARVAEEIVAVGTDIYRTQESRREVLVLAAALQPGDTGGALVNVTGEVIGVVFAVDPERDSTSYALADDEVRAVLDTVDLAGADTGACLVS